MEHEEHRHGDTPGDTRRTRKAGGRRLRVVERLLWACAAVCLLPLLTAWTARAYLGAEPLNATVNTTIAAENDIADSAGERADGSAAGAPGRQAGDAAFALRSGDKSDWAAGRISAFERLRKAFSPPVIGALVLPEQGDRIPVYPGVNEIHMTLGAAHLEDTAPLDGDGNIAITAHRDGTFRVLKDVEIGDPLVLHLAGQERAFTVTRRSVVTPDRVDVLDPTPVTTLTLVTCYPFWFVGSAPERFILQAELDGSAHSRTHPDVRGEADSPAGSGARTHEPRR